MIGAEHKKADWDFWGKMVELPLWKIIFLWSDREPDNRFCSQISEQSFPQVSDALLEMGIIKSNEIDAYRASGLLVYDFVEQELEVKYQMCLNHILAQDSLQVAKSHPNLPYSLWTINLNTFREWALSNNFRIPDQFPSNIGETKNDSSVFLPTRSSAIKNSGARLIEIPYVTEEILKIIEAMKVAHTQGETSTKALKSLLESSFSDIGYKVPDVAIEQYATLIRPDEVCFNDPRSRKTRKPESKSSRP
jgi:hypothetical protein